MREQDEVAVTKNVSRKAKTPKKISKIVKKSTHVMIAAESSQAYAQKEGPDSVNGKGLLPRQTLSTFYEPNNWEIAL